MAHSIRSATAADAPAIASIYGEQVRKSYASFETEPPTAAAMEQRMVARPRLPWLVAVDSAAVLGFAYAARHRERAAYRWSADVSVYLASDATGRGIGRALYEQLLPAVASLG